MANGRSSPNTEPVAQAQIEALGKQIDTGFADVKGLLLSYEKRLRDVEQREAGCQPLLNSRISAVEKTVNEHDETIKKLVLVSDRLENISRWILGIFTSLVVVLLTAYITGRLTVIFNR